MLSVLVPNCHGFLGAAWASESILLGLGFGSQEEPNYETLAPRQGSDKVFTPSECSRAPSRPSRTRYKLHSHLKPNENGNYVNESWLRSLPSPHAEPSHWQAFKIFEQAADNRTWPGQQGKYGHTDKRKGQAPVRTGSGGGRFNTLGTTYTMGTTGQPGST